MAILGITNRAENWKTATYFAPLFGHASARVARRLLPDAQEQAALQPSDVRLELFWRGIRDYISQRGGSSPDDAVDFAERYERLFPTLHREVTDFNAFRPLKAWNYKADTAEKRSRLESNLRNTEFDIVVESPTHLFIGEAKHEMSFGTSSRNVLPHQLIRQYVTAHVLLDLLGDQKKEVVPFVVADDIKEIHKKKQVRFMLDQQWMRRENVLEWGEIEALW